MNSSSSLIGKLLAGTFVVTVEVNPPADHDPEKALREVSALPEQIDAIDITNCAFSKVRLSPVALGHLIQERFGCEVIINYTCRDRNIIATKSDLLGALALGIRNVLCMTGDDPKSLGQSIKALRPAVDADAAAATGERQAAEDDKVTAQ